jgi:hypothetical protein
VGRLLHPPRLLAIRPWQKLALPVTDCVLTRTLAKMSVVFAAEAQAQAQPTLTGPAGSVGEDRYVRVPPEEKELEYQTEVLEITVASLSKRPNLSLRSSRS